ncbi:hypothetical protein KKF34_16040 [Myxococcota bacterium]|nr:hypothetical protein [Myxococcota bacterium]MBU1380210.1 hypothetical protein [Myxococcota bacterium]MBU1498388.1 hypothetical protein [Myxococcota bacterium]
MKRFLVFIIVTSLFAFTAGCEDDEQSSEAMCEMFEECELQDYDACLVDRGSLALSDECKDEIFAASCEDHALYNPPYMDTCFEPCTIQSIDCVGAQLHYCTGTHLMKYECASICYYQIGGVYSGVCGERGPNGEYSSNGGPVCWCHVD